MSACKLIFPHQLRLPFPLQEIEGEIYLIEEYLFFKQYAFHQQKIAFHRATMKAYHAQLEQQGISVTYVDAQEARSDIRVLVKQLADQGVSTIHVQDPTDNWLSKRLLESAQANGIELVEHDSTLFLNQKGDLGFFRPDKKKFFQTEFYIQQRKARQILTTESGEPEGGKWSYDPENRKKYPKAKTPPTVRFPESNAYVEEAQTYVQQHFANNPGKLGDNSLYPVTRADALKWLNDFLATRFEEFGPYEDAIVQRESILHHSLLTPMMNVSLLHPQEVLDAALGYARKHDIPLNSTEGFVRQIMGWREFIRGVYEAKGTYERNLNFWGFSRKIPDSFYSGTTGILPVDQTIHKVLDTGYCHHIERLMVLGNFMLLCEFDPDEVYRWFMELFIDAYDWVMVPNVYGMSQFADGGTMSTKPYISGSNYLMKMSDYPKGPWQQTWDGLFWRFMDVHRDFFTKNPRLGMLVRTFDKMAPEKRAGHLEAAGAFLEKLR